jgi:farnesyl-diphosphate farnesyltransferase
MALAKNTALQVLEKTSRTFYLPISRLPNGLQEAVASGYLCMRAIDEIEDHPDIDGTLKAKILESISSIFQAQTTLENFAYDSFHALFDSIKIRLPEVSTRIGEWACYAPASIAPRIWEATASMADRMAVWAEKGFNISSKTDLDRYTYGVAGAVGLLLCDIWGWFENSQLDRSKAIQFGRGLQLVNILRNRQDDLSRGVDFYPRGWSDTDMFLYAKYNLDNVTDEALRTKSNHSTFISFISIPRALAYATLQALKEGKEKITRTEVIEIVQKLVTN